MHISWQRSGKELFSLEVVSTFSFRNTLIGTFLNRTLKNETLFDNSSIIAIFGSGCLDKCTTFSTQVLSFLGGSVDVVANSLPQTVFRACIFPWFCKVFTSVFSHVVFRFATHSLAAFIHSLHRIYPLPLQPSSYNF